MHQRKLQDLKEFTLATMKEHELDVMESNHPIQDAKKVLQEILRIENKHKMDLGNVKEQGKAKQGSITNEIQAFKSQMATLEGEKNSYHIQIQELTNQIHQLEHSIRQASLTDIPLDHLQSTLKQEQDLLVLAKSFDFVGTESKIREYKGEIQKYESLLQLVSDEMGSMNRQSDTRAKLGIKQADLNRKKESLNAMKESLYDSVSSIIGCDAQGMDLPSILVKLNLAIK